jgi:hypothetical protein
MNLNFTHDEKRDERRVRDAHIILSILFDLIPTPRSVVDFGGGRGSWVKACSDLSVPEVTCIEHPDTLKGPLLLDLSCFVPCDLSIDPYPGIRSDLAMCLEVAEHLPEDRSETLVHALTRSAPLILFSAAIPGQPGDHHINCQPPKYWNEKFKSHGFTRIDCIRPRILMDATLPYWWKQNLFLFSRDQSLSIETQWPTCHNDEIELIAERQISLYRSALDLQERTFSQRLKQSLKNKMFSKRLTKNQT